MEHIEALVNFLLPYQAYSYALVFGILILCGFGLPIPEDVVLVSGGILSGLGSESSHLTELCYMLGVSFAGVLLGDSTMYILGRVFGYRIQKFKPMRALLSPKRFAQVQKLFNKYGIWVLFAGMSRRVGFFKFIGMDGFAAIISVPIWVLIGHYGAQNREALANWLHDSKMAILIFTVVIISALVLYIRSRMKKEKLLKAEKQQAAARQENSK